MTEEAPRLEVYTYQDCRVETVILEAGPHPVDSEILAATAMAFGPDGELSVLESQDALELQYDPLQRYVLRQRSANGIWRSIPSER